MKALKENLVNEDISIAAKSVKLEFNEIQTLLEILSIYYFDCNPSLKRKNNVEQLYSRLHKILLSMTDRDSRDYYNQYYGYGTPDRFKYYKY